MFVVTAATNLDQKTLRQQSLMLFYLITPNSTKQHLNGKFKLSKNFFQFNLKFRMKNQQTQQ